MLKWDKAKYSGSDSKSGGAKFSSPSAEGNKGIPPGSSVPKASVAKQSGIDNPGGKGNKGVISKSEHPSAKAPLSE